MLKIYETWEAYNAATMSDAESTVSLITENNAVMYHGVNVIKHLPKIGDFCLVLNGKKLFMDPGVATAEMINALPVVGKVYDVQGRLVRVVGGVNTTSKQWSDVCDFSIVPDNSLFDGNSHSLDITLQNAYVGKMNYTLGQDTPESDELKDFIKVLGEWLETNAPKWEAYVNDAGQGILQLSTYDSYESTCTITSCTLTKLVGNELAAETISGLKNENGQYFNYYQVMCYNRALSYFATNGSAPAQAPTDIVANTAPVTRAYFEENELGVNLRTKFGTYENYIFMCQAHLRELNKGIMQFRSGKEMTAKLLTKTVLKRGVEECPYAQAVWANSYAPVFDGLAIENFEAGKWWSPSMYELGLLVRNLKTDYSDPVNSGMTLVTGWSRINPASSRWSVCRSNTISAWSYNNSGIVNGNSFYYSFAVSAVSAFNLED